MSFLSLLLSQSRYTQYFSCLQEWTQRALMNIHFAMIDKFDECMKIGECNILQNDYGMFTRCTLKLRKKNKFQLSPKIIQKKNKVTKVHHCHFHSQKWNGTQITLQLQQANYIRYYCEKKNVYKLVYRHFLFQFYSFLSAIEW